MGECREYTLSQLCSSINYGYTESASLEPIGPKFLRITDIVPSFINWDTVPYCKISDADFIKYKLEKGDIVIARTGATTGYNKTIKDEVESVFASYLIRYKINEEIAYPFYIGYVLQSDSWYDYVNAIAGGSAQPGANAKQLGSFEITLPSLPVQKAIASVLSNFDDKIALLHRQNATLEAMAETLFRQLFVVEANEDWEEVTVKDVCSIITKGTTPTTLKKSFVNFGINFIKAESLTDSGGFVHGKFAFIDDDTHTLLKRSQIQSGDILLTIAGTIGRVAFVTEDILPANTNQAVAILRANYDLINPLFLYYLFKSDQIREDFNSRVVHAVQPNLSLGEIGSIVFKLPPQQILSEGMEMIKSVSNKKLRNYNQIQTLTKFRDTLLPKLMSGQATVELAPQAEEASVY